MDQILKEALDKMINFIAKVDYQNKQELNAYIAIYDKLKEIISIIDDNSNVDDLLSQKMEEYKLEQELLEKFGPSILLYLLMKNSE